MVNRDEVYSRDFRNRKADSVEFGFSNLLYDNPSSVSLFGDCPISGRFFVIDARHLNMNVDTVKQGTANAFLITQNLRQRIGTLFDRIAVVTARTGIHTK